MTMDRWRNLAPWFATALLAWAVGCGGSGSSGLDIVAAEREAIDDAIVEMECVPDEFFMVPYCPAGVDVPPPAPNNGGNPTPTPPEPTQTVRVDIEDGESVECVRSGRDKCTIEVEFSATGFTEREEQFYVAATSHPGSGDWKLSSDQAMTATDEDPTRFVATVEIDLPPDDTDALSVQVAVLTLPEDAPPPVEPDLVLGETSPSAVFVDEERPLVPTGEEQSEPDPTPTPEATPSPTPSGTDPTPAASPATPAPTPSAGSSPGPVPTGEPSPGASPGGPTPGVEPTPLPTLPPVETPAPEPTERPQTSPEPEPTDGPVETPAPTAPPEETPVPEPTGVVEPTPDPGPTEDPGPSPQPTEVEPTPEPTATSAPEPTPAPTGVEPEPTPDPEPTLAPEESPTPEPAPTPTALEPTPAPDATGEHVFAPPAVRVGGGAVPQGDAWRAGRTSSGHSMLRPPGDLHVDPAVRPR